MWWSSQCPLQGTCFPPCPWEGAGEAGRQGDVSEQRVCFGKAAARCGGGRGSRHDHRVRAGGSPAGAGASHGASPLVVEAPRRGDGRPRPPTHPETLPSAVLLHLRRVHFVDEDAGGEAGHPAPLSHQYVASSLSYMFSVPHFANQGLLPLEPAAEVEFPVPGVGNVEKKDVWEYFVKGGPFQLDVMILCLKDLAESFPTATYLVNSTEELEPEAFQALKEPIPFTGEVAKVVSIGPLEQSFAYKGVADSFELTETEKSKKLSSEVGEWLDDQPDGSVLYISFGTIFSLQAKQVLELAHALEASGQRFLWIIRLPNVPHIMVSKQPDKEEISAILPPGFEERTKGRGLLYSSWAPQPKILAHRAVGLFMSHCGWNPILESISTSTPILGRPLFTDQWLNATTVEERFQIGIVIKDNEGAGFERGCIETSIKRMMEGEEGNIARRNVAHLNKVLRDADTPSSGFSSRNLEQYVGEIFAMDKKLNHSHDA